MSHKRDHTSSGGISPSSGLARISGSRAGIEPPSSGSGGASATEGSSGRGCSSRIAAAPAKAGLSVGSPAVASVCASNACSIDALAGGVGAATAASALSVTTAVVATAAAVAVEDSRVKGCGSATAVEFQPGSLPCLGIGISPYFDAG